MTFKKSLIGLAAVAILAGAAFAQVNAPQVSTINPTADLIQIIPGGQPSAQSRYTTPALLTATGGYYKSTAGSGGALNYTFANAQRLAAFDAGGTITSMYWTMAPAPSDGTEQCVFSTGAITFLYPTANTGQTVSDAVSTLAANGRVCYLYGSANATWNRSQ